jgi:hypothetical protein
MKTLSFFSIISIFFLSCAKERIEGNGNIITETRPLSEFSGVSSSGSKNISISYGTAFKVELRGSSNLIPKYRTRIVGSTIKLGYENLVRIENDDIRVYVTVPRIKEVSLSGSGNIDISGAFPKQDRFETYISGSGDVNLEDDMQVDRVITDISGSGKANLNPLQCQTADVNISGSGEVKLGVEEHLKVKISGSGKVYYGNASVDSRISGSGKVVKY